MVGYVADPVFCEVLKEVRDQLVDIEIDEVFFITVLQCLRSPKFPPEAKTGFSELVFEKFEKEIQYLNDQIQSYEFRDPKKFLETLPPSKQETIRMPMDVFIDSLQLEAYVEELGKHTWSGFYDLVVAYMEYLFSLNDKLDCLLHNQTHFVHV